MPSSKSAYRRYKIIDGLLRNSSRPYPTMGDIQEKCLEKLDFYPSADTIEKDIRNMKLPEPDGFDAPIKYCRKHRGYYYTDAHFSLNALTLSDSEIVSIKESLELIKSLGGANRVNANFTSAVEKILATFHEEFPDNTLNRKIVQLDYVEGAKGFEHFNGLLKACQNQQPISFVHYSYSKRVFKAVQVHPIRLKEFENKWYLIGYSEYHRAIRTFGLDRIYDPVGIKKKYIKCDDHVIERYCHDIYGVYPIEQQPKQEITFWTSFTITNYFEAYPIHPTQVGEKNESGSCFFTLHLVPSMELIKLFRSYGNNLQVIHPEWLREQTLSLQ